MANATGLLVVKEITPVIDTAIYAANDVLFVPIEIVDAGRVAGANVVLNGIVMLDEDDETAFAFDLVFLRSNVSLGTLNGAVDISDANAAEVLGVVKVAATDVEDLINNMLYFRNGLGLQMQLAAASKSLWVGGILRSATPTFAAATNLKLKLGITQD
jgi:hypothetical protein